jgi:hypothetical protein
MEQASTEIKKHCILFTGHMLDKPDRAEPRFPAAREEAAKHAIRRAVQYEKEMIQAPIAGMAGGACGGDILFHEVCEEMAIPTELFLALPKEEYTETSVGFAGQDWLNRFNKLYQKLPLYVLSQPEKSPNWLGDNPHYSVWERVNVWMLHEALLNGGKHLTLIALWDGKGGDGPGGTAHLVEQAKEKGAKIVIIDIKELE